MPSIEAALARLVWQRAESRREYCQIPQEADDAPFEIDNEDYRLGLREGLIEEGVFPTG